MKTRIYKLMMVISFFLCHLTGYGQADKRKSEMIPDSRTNASELITPQSELLATVGKEAQQTILKRMDLDYHPTEDIRQDLGVYMQEGTPATNYATVRFVPVISIPFTNAERKRASLLSTCNEVAWMYGKTVDGENIYFMAKYTDWSKWKPNTESEAYKHRVKALGQTAVDAENKRMQNRTGAFRWQISYFPKGTFLYEEIEYARQHSDDGSFFAVTSGPFHYCKICFFKDGKVYTCNRHKEGEDVTAENLWIYPHPHRDDCP